ncbi:hypothetical protein MIND_01210800 [Mycena indigotica]|uniref:DUF4336 domain-containing protein n=1 Tax=Mycena indigotica TaxID=2126181 RepID=A0A8H6VU00_9AGAR|nr:uncharacterized protein MIND_01210800 [Mycena indigotica]KAF7291856.1 hypothetical protein MIND_01210800 [Mycena indigotica]
MENCTVLREITQSIWTFSRPFSRFGILPIGGRSTAIKLRNGGVWVLASTTLDADTKAKIDELGPVQYIVGADAVHHLFLGEFKRAYPSAKLIAPAAVLERTNDKSLQFDGVWGRDPPETIYGFEDDIKACYFSGFKNKDVAFFHLASKTMIEADLLFNLPCTEQYSKTKSSGSLPLLGSFGPYSWLTQKFASAMGEDKAAMKRDVRTVAGWDFARIIPCHGDVIETGGKEAWLEAYKVYLD